MKLPQYTPGAVQTLGRESPGAIVGAGRAEQQALESVGGAVQGIYESESVSQAEKANLAYMDTMEDYLRETKSYDTDAQGNVTGRIWDNPEERYQQAEKAAREAAGKLTNTGMANRLFNDKADALSNKYSAAWGGKVLNAQRQDQAATMMVSYNKHLDAGRFDDARMTLIKAQAVNLLSPAQFQVAKDNIDYQQNYFESGELAATATTKNAEKLRQDFNDDKSLKPADRNRVLAQVDGALLENTYNNMQGVIQTEESKSNLQGAVTAGQNYYNKLVRTPAAKLGGDEKFKMKQLAAAQSVLNLYKGQLSSNKSAALRTDNLNCFYSGRCVTSPDHNETIAEDAFATAIMGWSQEGTKDYGRTQGYSEVDLINNKDGILDKTMELSAKIGFIPKEAARILDTTFYQGDPNQPATAQQVTVLVAMGKLAEKNKAAVYARGDNDKLAKAVSLYNTLGTTPQAAQRAIQLTFARNQMSQADLKGYDAYAKSSDYKEFADDNFDKYLKERFPGDGFLWLDKTPGMKVSLQNRTKSLAKTYLPLTGGDQEMAMKAALYELTAEYSVSAINGEDRVERFAPDKYVHNGDKLGGAWIPAQAESAIKQRNPDIDMANVEILAAPNFNPNDPVYIFIHRNPDTGMSQQIGTGFRFDYEQTKEYAEEAKVIAEQEEAKAEVAETAKKRSEWIKEHGGKNPRSFGPHGYGRPYGEDPGQSISAKLTRTNKRLREEEAARARAIQKRQGKIVGERRRKAKAKEEEVVLEGPEFE